MFPEEKGEALAKGRPLSSRRRCRARSLGAACEMRMPRNVETDALVSSIGPSVADLKPEVFQPRASCLQIAASQLAAGRSACTALEAHVIRWTTP